MHDAMTGARVMVWGGGVLVVTRYRSDIDAGAPGDVRGINALYVADSSLMPTIHDPNRRS